MNWRRIQWLAITMPALLAALFEFLRHRWLEPTLPDGWGNLASAFMVALGVYGFVHVLAQMLERAGNELARNRERTAVILERQRIGREMHDSVAQTLFFLTVKLREVQRMIEAGDRDPAATELKSMEQHLTEAYQHVRQVIADFKRADWQDFEESLRRIARQSASRAGLKVVVHMKESWPLPVSTQQHLLAIVQEAIVNAGRHGRAHRVEIQVLRKGNQIEMLITDDGQGFDLMAPRTSGSFGISIMTERAHIIGGLLTLDSVPGKGTRLIIHIPEVTYEATERLAGR